MFRRIVLAGAATTFLAAAFAFAITASQWTTATALTNCSSTSSAWSANETALLGLINGLRAQQGVAALKQSPTLSNMAAWMAEDMAAHGGGVANAPTHDDYLGRTFMQRASACGVGGYYGENVGWGFSTPQSIFNGWSASPGHYSAMINPNFKAVGLAQSGTSWVADFSSIDDSGSTAPPTNTPGNTPTSTTTPSATTPASGTPTASPTSNPAAGTPIPGYKLPSSFPIKRAMLPLLSAE